MFMNYCPTLMDSNESGFTIRLEENVLTEHLELPAEIRSKLLYNNIYCGIIKGCLQMVRTCTYRAVANARE